MRLKLMNSKKFTAFVSLALALSMVMPIGASAAGKKPIGNNQKNVQVTGQRAQIKSLNKDIITLKVEAKKIVAKIRSDIAGTGGNTEITGSQDYKDIIALISNVKTMLSSAENIKYKDGLKKVAGRHDGDIAPALDAVIAQLNQKKADLQAAVDSLNAALKKADTIASLKKTDIGKWSSFKDQANQKKQQIKQNHENIASVNSEVHKLISQIIATASANQDILSTNSDAEKTIESKLAEVKKTIKGINDKSISQAVKEFNKLKDSKDYNGALAQLDTIISLQQQKLNNLNSVKTDLQTILTTLNNLVSPPKTAA